MGALARAFERRDTTYQQVWGADRDNPAMDFGGKRVTRDGALGLSAVFACIRFIVDSYSTLPLHNYEEREQQDPVGWMVRPVPRDPATSLVVHLQQVGTSLLLEGNSYTFASPSVLNPQELRVLDPRNVEPRREKDGSIVYTVRDYRSQMVGEFDWSQIVHIPLIRLPGELKGISPLEAERQTFSSAISAEALGANFLRNGTWLSAIVEMPAGVSVEEEDAKQLLRDIEQKYAGTGKAGKVGMLTQGAKLNQLSVTPEQAQFLETRMYDDERIFRIYRVPPALAGMVREGATSNASSVSQALAFEKHTIRPFVTLIETAYRTLLPPGQYLKFNTKGLLRGDPETQAKIYHFGLSDKWLALEEVREYEELPARDDMTGLLETPNNNAPGESPPKLQAVA